MVEGSLGEGLLRGLEQTIRAEPETARVSAHASLYLGDVHIPLEPLVGNQVSLGWRGRVCVACEAPTTAPLGGGYCGDCFANLARCDVCFVSPDRCHHEQGTCREPQWAAQICMQPHSVYLAVTSGPKVGITVSGREYRRWVDQGASSAVKIATAPTRRAAGHIERVFAQGLADRTDWKAMLVGPRKDYDLMSLAVQLQRKHANLNALIPAVDRDCGHADWVAERELVQIDLANNLSSPAVRLKLNEANPTLCEHFFGVRGGYLLFESGVLNVREHCGTLVHMATHTAIAGGGRIDTPQQNLF